MKDIIGLGRFNKVVDNGFDELIKSSNGFWVKGVDGVKHILTPRDKKTEFIIYRDKTLVYVKSAMGYPAIYPLDYTKFEPKAKAVLMDLDGTSIHSESFWMWIIEKSIARLMGNKNFCLEDEDEPYVSGHSVSEHLSYCIEKYCPDLNLENARKHYFEITHEELGKISKGEGRVDAFKPSPGLKEFLYTLKDNNIKIGLVTSGLYEKAWPEILSAFKTLNMGNPLDFYDGIISGGFAVRKNQVGSIGELAPKPHPWLYAEIASVGLGIEGKDCCNVIGIEDSAAGIVSLRLAGFAAIGISGGNIKQSGITPLSLGIIDDLREALPIVIGR